MKKIKLALNALGLTLIIAFASSCAGPKQVFYFQPGPPTPKVAAKDAKPELALSASTAPGVVDLPRTSLTITPETAQESTAPVTISKKELRKLVRKTLKNIKDSTDTRNRNQRMSVAVNKERLAQLESEAREFKNSVRVQNDDKKLTVDMKRPIPEFSQTEWILLGVAALLVLLILLSLPVLGPILGIVLALAIIALGVGLLTGYIDLNI
ncbi:hypothetical protein AAE02nite_19670 [Adhaeribacter aerolatus]|uniref:Lipoprotein n=1 Tax=Adhaeribacter aerolatus TaxID=670289 RepID=A0A512AX66_9BACT|nr:hypothetical protein [Adhaeribacter aerolatus]GEO04303.1 hypothetical protein AAE02nite_19670 [Adhaeribacter aerolatus]